MANLSETSIGLVAGWGRYPIVVAEALRAQGQRVVGLGVRDHADPDLRKLCDDYREIGLAKLGGAIRYFRRRGVIRATMAGKIHKTLLLRRFHLLHHIPDWRAMRTFVPHYLTKTKDRTDDTLLGTIVAEFAKDGIEFLPATDLVPEVLVKYGMLSGRGLTSAQWKDIEFGWRLAKELGRLDVGQSVAVTGRAVLAVEAVEGTDECIRRAGRLCNQAGFTVVKVAKPQQDMRFDVPTIGLGTMQTLVESGARVLAVEAHKTIILDEPAVLAYAARHHLTLVALDEAAIAQRKFAA